MESWSDGFIHANGIRIHYYRTGGDLPKVVLNHGVMDDALCWRRVTQELESTYDVIMLDARGHGFSDAGNGDYSSETRAKDLAEAIVELGLDKPVVGGHSLGADSSIHLAGLFPDIPRAIFLEDPPIVMPGDSIYGGFMGRLGDRSVALSVAVGRLLRLLPMSLGKLIARRLMPYSPDEEVIIWLESKKRASNEVLENMKRSTRSTFPLPEEMLKKISVPTLLITGDRDYGAVVSGKAASEMSQLVPDLRNAHIRRAGHDIHRMKFDEFMDRLRAFLVEVYN